MRTAMVTLSRGAHGGAVDVCVCVVCASRRDIIYVHWTSLALDNSHSDSLTHTSRYVVQ